MKYKIDFGLAFILCIIIMIFGQIWTFLGERPEAFVYGSIIYKIVAVISFILTNLAIGTAAAIIFYFMGQFLEKKKSFDIYTSLRADVLWLLYAHMMILKDTEQFKELNNSDRGKSDSFNVKDVKVLMEKYKNIDINHSQFENNLQEYFTHIPHQRLKTIMSKFEKQANILSEKKEVRFFKGSKDLIEEVTTWFENDGDLAMSFSLFISNTNEKHTDFLDGLVKAYISFLNETIILYEEIEEFIDCIENKRIVKFMRMVN